MSSEGYFRVCAASPLTEVAAVEENIAIIKDVMAKAHESRADMLVLPELCVTGYTCADLFQQQLLIDKALEALVALAQASSEYEDLLTWVGVPVRWRGALYNCAAALCEGKVLAVIPKTYLPSYQEFYEKRWFASAATVPPGERIDIAGEDVPFGTDILLRHKGVTVGAEICEDLWTVVPPSSYAAMGGAQVIANLSASNEVIGKHEYLLQLIKQQSARARCGYVYASAGRGESTQDVVYSGKAIIAENGHILAQSPTPNSSLQTPHSSLPTPNFSLQTPNSKLRTPNSQLLTPNSSLLTLSDLDIQILDHDRINGGSFADAQNNSHLPAFRIVPTGSPIMSEEKRELLRNIDPYPFVPSDTTRRDERCAEILAIQAQGLMRRLRATGCKTAVVGISGGLDSTLALLVIVEAFDRLGLDRKGIIGVTMPGFGTTHRTHSNADTLMEALGITVREIPITAAVRQHFADIGHDETVHDVVYENSQARERTQILMDIANQTGGMVIGTGDLSELALGWATYNGDHISMYGVNVSIPKTLVKYLVGHKAEQSDDPRLKEVLLDIIDTPISPELTPADENDNIRQKTEDLVGPYPLHDFFLYQMLRYGFEPRKIFSLALIAFRDVYDRATILKWLKVFYRRFFSQQFKRSCLPDGPKVGSVCLSPRGDWRMPSDVSARLWLDSLPKE